MLPNHAPLVIAEQFETFEALYSGRIDLGLVALHGWLGSSTTLDAGCNLQTHLPVDLRNNRKNGLRNL